MTAMQTLVVLANSCKNNGRCLAGKVWGDGRFGAWIRPVSTHPTGALTLQQQRLSNGSHPALLDVVAVPLCHPTPSGFQSENHLLVTGQLWNRLGRLTTSALPELVDPVETLWINGHSTLVGCNDRVPESRLAELRDSLYLIGPMTVWLHVAWDKLRANFVYHGVTYDLAMTDPDLKAAYAEHPGGVVEQRPASFVCVSLAPAWNGYAYKLAAAILTP